MRKWRLAVLAVGSFTGRGIVMYRGALPAPMPWPAQAPVAATSQSAWQADVRIQALDLTPLKGFVNVRVVIGSDGTDGARGASLHLFLPLGTKAARLPPGCQPSPSPNAAAQARIDCALGELRVRDLREVTIVATAPPAGVVARFTAFAYSDTPDPQMTNNYAERVLP
jgi:hypothetical protein